MPIRIHSAAMLLMSWILLPFIPAPPAVADEPDQTFQTAVFLLRDSMTVRPNGTHNLQIGALRQLRDPELSKYFEHLMQSDRPSLIVHGFLGLAEADPDKLLNLKRLAAVTNGRLQAEMASAAIDSDLLSIDQAKQIVAAPDLDVTVRILASCALAKAAQPLDVDLLREASQSDNLGREALAGMLLLQVNDPQGQVIIERINRSTDSRKDEVREMVLQTALRYEFNRIGDWAMALASDPAVNTRLALIALRAAIRFSAPKAEELWKQKFFDSSDPAQRTRLALIALNNAQWVNPKLFEPLMASDDPIIQQMGRAGTAISDKRDAGSAVAALVAKQQPVINGWALNFAKKYDQEEDAQAILLALIKAYQGQPRNQAQRFDDAITATEFLYNRNPTKAPDLFKPLLAPSNEPMLLQGILLGLLRCSGNNPQSVLEDLPPFPNPNVKSLALLLAAKNGAQLGDTQLHDLELIVRGGGNIPTSLRIQAAWIYLKRTNQSGQALEKILGR